MNPRLFLVFWILSHGGTLVVQAAADRELRFTNVINVVVPHTQIVRGESLNKGVRM
jgi:hypothetical protein